MRLKGRGPVQYLDRSLKAKMIGSFFFDHLQRPVMDMKILDIGCGNGLISSFFGKQNTVVGVDVEDKPQRVGRLQYSFVLIKDESLPFVEDTFDIVISHHVIEHVSNQSHHLKEIKRVLKRDGAAYLGCPNRASPFMAGHTGNNQLLSFAEATKLIESVGLEWFDYYTKLLSEPRRFHCETLLGQYIPVRLIRLFKPWYPGHCFILNQT